MGTAALNWPPSEKDHIGVVLDKGQSRRGRLENIAGRKTGPRNDDRVLNGQGRGARFGGAEVGSDLGGAQAGIVNGDFIDDTL